ncbi:hypothetical protein D9M73_290630 [compost metagenome]
MASRISAFSAFLQEGRDMTRVATPSALMNSSTDMGNLHFIVVVEILRTGREQQASWLAA